MYLPTFHKISLENRMFRVRKFGRHAPIAGLWFGYLMYHSIYNMVYTDIYPPARGVLRRVPKDDD